MLWCVVVCCGVVCCGVLCCGVLWCVVVQLNAELNVARKDLRHAQTIMQLDELKSRKRVLRRYNNESVCGGGGYEWLLQVGGHCYDACCCNWKT